MKPTIKLDTQLDEHPTFINVEGEIDTSTAKELRRQLLKVLEGDTGHCRCSGDICSWDACAILVVFVAKSVWGITTANQDGQWR
mgnify:CR=1 FL=1